MNTSIPPAVKWLLVFGMLLVPAAARGDGVYVPKAAYPALPTIPAQRAVIVYRHHVETLVVELRTPIEAAGAGRD